MDMQPKILERIADVTAQKKMRVIVACESGSRAWGFPSTDSDYDVRAIVCRHPDHYLKMADAKKDAWDVHSDDDIDLALWDVRKAARLIFKGNAPVMEHLLSPIQYLDTNNARAEMSHLAKVYFNPKAVVYHHLALAGGIWKKYFDRGGAAVATRKKYLYVLRSLTAAQYVVERRCMYPMDFAVMCEAVHMPDPVHGIIEDLIKEKANGAEMDTRPVDGTLNRWIKTSLASLDNDAQNMERGGYRDPGPLNAMTVKMIKETWA